MTEKQNLSSKVLVVLFIAVVGAAAQRYFSSSPGVPVSSEPPAPQNALAPQDRAAAPAPPQSVVSPTPSPPLGESKVTPKELGKIRELLASGKGGARPGELEEIRKMAEAQKAAVFETEQNARNELSALQSCVSQGVPDLSVQAKQIPPEAREQFMQLPYRMQADCIATARKIAEKYPALQHEVESRVLASASRKALELSKAKNQGR